MPGDVQIKLKMPIPSHGGIADLTFASWLPVGEKNQIVVEQQNVTLALSFEMSNVGLHGIKKVEELAKVGSVLVDSITCNFTIHSCDDNMIAYMIRCQNNNTNRSEPLYAAYEELGRSVYRLGHVTVQRLVSYFRTNKGQFWLEERDIDPDMQSFFTSSRAMFTVDGTNWHSWNPPSNVPITSMWTGEDTWITEADWERAMDFMKSRRRTSLASELLARAFSEAWLGQRRSALIDAVSSLELAISDFAGSSKAHEAFKDHYSLRVEKTSLKSQVTHLGLQATVRYLLPVIFPEDKVSAEVITTCQEAVNERNSLAHRGYRNVSKEKLFRYLRAIRNLRRTLREYTEETGDVE